MNGHLLCCLLARGPGVEPLIASLAIERGSDFSLLFFNVVDYGDWVLSSEPTLPSPPGLDKACFFLLPGLMFLHGVLKGFCLSMQGMLACDFPVL